MLEPFNALKITDADLLHSLRDGIHRRSASIRASAMCEEASQADNRLTWSHIKTFLERMLLPRTPLEWNRVRQVAEG